MFTFKQFLLEGNPLARKFGLEKKGHTSFMVSAERKSRTPKGNKYAEDRAKRYLTRKKIGYRNTAGKWDEGGGVGRETSMNVQTKNPTPRESRRVERAVKHVAKKWKQDAYIKIDKKGTGVAHYTNDTPDYKKGAKVEYGDTHYNVDNPYGVTQYKPRRPEEKRPRFAFMPK